MFLQQSKENNAYLLGGLEEWMLSTRALAAAEGNACIESLDGVWAAAPGVLYGGLDSCTSATDSSLAWDQLLESKSKEKPKWSFLRRGLTLDP